jgi:copper(I)-binding protein
MSLPRIGTRLVPLLALMLVVVACGSGSSSVAPSAPAIDGAWVRPPMGADLPAAGYMTITGGTTDDALVAAGSPVAGEVQIHETMAGGSGMTGMRPVEQIPVSAGATVKLEPGGYHLMLMDLTEVPAVGSTVQITLTFETAGDIVVQAEVRAG